MEIPRREMDAIELCDMLSRRVTRELDAYSYGMYVGAELIKAHLEDRKSDIKSAPAKFYADMSLEERSEYLSEIGKGATK